MFSYIGSLVNTLVRRDIGQDKDQQISDSFPHFQTRAAVQDKIGKTVNYIRGSIIDR